MQNKILLHLITPFLALFQYDLNLIEVPGSPKRIMICFHGMEGDATIAHDVSDQSSTKETVIGFNFPNAGKLSGTFDPHKTVFGTPKEILPALFILKECLAIEDLQEMSLYGHSAGGGAIINVLHALTSHHFDDQLQKIGIHSQEKEKILQLLRNGKIILDTPLKSVAEIIDFRGESEELIVIGNHYQTNDMEPIEVLKKLKDLSMNVAVHFQIPDEVLSNRDDNLYTERLKKCNSGGKTRVIFGYGEGHSLPHHVLWSQLSADDA
ncbi:MAG: hypothetical protein SNF33_08340 [Candidatus Algichlamydia australiensis]|nr:hypothetical protein [Chlamydiales bacterium]